MFKIKRSLSIIVLFFFAVSLGSCGGGGGGSSSGGGGGSSTGSTIIVGPVANPSAVLAGQQTTVNISAYLPSASGSTVAELYQNNGGSFTKIGNMVDMASNKVYSISVPINESITNAVTLRIVTSNATQDITIPVIYVPAYSSNTELNQAASDLYTEAVATKALFAGMNNNPSPQDYKNISTNLYDMFGKFEGITKQDIVELSRSEAVDFVPLAPGDALRRERGTILSSAFPVARSAAGNAILNLFNFANDTNSCASLLDLINNHPDDPRLSSLEQEIAANSNGTIEFSDFTDPYAKDVAALFARNYILKYQITLTLGCQGGTLKEAADVVVKAQTAEYTDIAGNSLDNIVGSLATGIEQDIYNAGKSAATIIGWFKDLLGNLHVSVVQAANNESYRAPAGTYNLYACFDGSTALAVDKNVLISAGQTTIVNLTPGTVVDGYTISGTVTFNGAGLSRVTINIANAENTLSTAVTTDSNGYYNYSGATNDFYTITPSLSGYTFSPASRSVSVNGGDVTGKDFTAIATTSTPSSPPSITNVSPNPVTGSSSQQTITLTGNNFQSGLSVTVGWTGGSKTLDSSQVTVDNANQVRIFITTTTVPDNWTVTVTNPDGQSSNIMNFSVVAPPPTPDTTPPTVPTGLTTTAVSSSQINLAWNASTDNVAVAGYKIFDSVGSYVKSVSTTSTSIIGLTPSTQYCFSVSAYDAANNDSGKSNQVCATTQTAPDTTAPSVPTGLTVTAVSSTQINLSWNASTDPDDSVAGYRIYRGGAPLTTVSATSTSDTGLSPSTQYCYTVSAYDTAGNDSAQSGSVCATTQSNTGSGLISW